MFGRSGAVAWPASKRAAKTQTEEECIAVLVLRGWLLLLDGLRIFPRRHDHLAVPGVELLPQRGQFTREAIGVLASYPED